MATPIKHPVRQGDVFGRLTVLEVFPGGSNSRVRVLCECGVGRVVRRDHLPSGRSRSCGCLNRESTTERLLTHGHVRRGYVTPEYRSWRHAKERTTNPNDRDWRYYGGRGIGMAAEWLHDFPAFLEHIGPRPGPGYSVDRIDNSGDYAPGNVRWATALEQVHNRRPRQRRAA